MFKVVVLFSGGIDSLAGYQWAAKEYGKANVCCMYVDFGHRYAGIEREAVRKLSEKLKFGILVRGFYLGDMEQDDAYIPLRNLFLLQLASLYADNIVFGMLRNENTPDKGPGFIRMMEQLLNSQYVPGMYAMASRHIQIETPFVVSTKTGVVRWYLANGGTKELVLDTVGCYNEGGKCGGCVSCWNRWVALRNNGIDEQYKQKPYEWALGQLSNGRKKAMKFNSPFTVWSKRRFLWEAHRALKTVYPSPLKEVWGRIHS